jgi:predicted acylesterase/phospholipase RssA
MSGWKPRSISFSSGGVKVIGQMGVLARLLEGEVLDEVRHWYGCSGGSVCAFLGALGVSAAWIRDAADHFHMGVGLEFTDDPVHIFMERWGMSSLERYRDFIGKFVDTWEPGASTWTFADFARERPGVGLTIISTNVTRGKQAIFGVRESPSMRIMDAIAASCSVTLFFTPWIDASGDIYTDGSVLEYYPWRCVEDKDNTLVIVCEEQGIYGRISSKNSETPPTTVIEFTERILCIARRGLADSYAPPRNWIALNNYDIGILEFHMSQPLRVTLLQSGAAAAAGWLAFRSRRITDSAGGTDGTHPPCEDRNTSSSDHPSPDRRLDSHQSQNLQPPVRSSPGSHTGARLIFRRWSV